MFATLLVVTLLFSGYASGCSLPSYLLSSGSTRRWLVKRGGLTVYEAQAGPYALNFMQSPNCSDTVCSTTPIAQLGCTRRLVPENGSTIRYDLFELKRIGPSVQTPLQFCAAFRALNDALVAYYLEVTVDGLPEHRRCQALLDIVKTEPRATPNYLLAVDYITSLMRGVRAPTPPCPLSGGFTFKSYAMLASTTTTNTGESLCANDTWRSSQLDADCFKGEGLEFTFPKPTCNLFGTLSTNVTLSCGINWVRKEINQLVALLHNAQSVTRLPDVQFWFLYINLDGRSDKVNATLEPLSFTCTANRSTFIADCLLASRQRHERGYRLVLTRRDAVRNCNDESADCNNLRSYCHTKPAFDFSGFCRRTCRMCPDDIPFDEPSPECTFHEADFQGSWYVHGDNSQTLKVDSGGLIRLSREGDEPFACKSFDSKDYRQRYSLQRYFTNGCLPRRICYEFWQLQNNNGAAALQSIAMSRQNSRSRALKDGETLAELCPEQAAMPLAKSAALRAAPASQSDLQPFQLLLRYPLMPQKCGLYGFLVAASSGEQDYPLSNITGAAKLNDLNFAVVTDLNFTTCRHSDRFVLKTINVADRNVAKSRLPTERQYRCFGNFKLHSKSIDDILIVADETVTAQFYCAIFTKLTDTEVATMLRGQNATDFKFSGMLQLIPIQNCTFSSAGYLASSVTSVQTWFYRNDVHYMNNCQQDPQVQSTVTRQFQQILSAVRNELQVQLGFMKLTQPQTAQKTTAVAAKRAHKSAKQEDVGQAQAVRASGSGRAVSPKVYTTFAACAITIAVHLSSILV